MRAPQCGFSCLRRTIRLSICGRQLVGVAHRPPRAVAQGLEPVLLVAVEDLVAGLAGDAELPADIASSPRRPAGGRQSAGVPPSPNTLSTASTPPADKGEKCYPCVRYELSPMSRLNRTISCANRLRKSGRAFGADTNRNHHSRCHYRNGHQGARSRVRSLPCNALRKSLSGKCERRAPDPARPLLRRLQMCAFRHYRRRSLARSRPAFGP